MLIELADVSRIGARSGSAKARFTIAWPSSNLPSMPMTKTLSPSVVICLRCRSETSVIGNRTTTLTRGTPR